MVIQTIIKWTDMTSCWQPFEFTFYIWTKQEFYLL